MRESKCACSVSPYFQTNDLREEASRQEYPTILDPMITAYVLGYVPGGTTANITTLLEDSAGVYNVSLSVPLTIAYGDTGPTVQANAITSINSYCTANGVPNPDAFIWLTSQPASARTINTPTRAINTAYAPSTALPTLVLMSVEVDAALSLSGGAKGTCTLEVSPTSAFTTVVNDSEVVNGNTGTLTIGLNTVGAGGGTMVAYVPAGYQYKAVTANTTGTPTYTVLSTTEIVGI